MRRLGLIVILLLVASACADEPESILDAGPRIPDDEGVVTDINFERVELEGTRRYPISPDVESFTSSGHEITPLVHWKDRYVQIGLGEGDGDRPVIWVAGIGIVVRADPPFVTYTGVLQKVEKGRAVFRDGTTLRLSPGIAVPKKNATVVVTLDTEKGMVTEIREQ